MSCDQDFYAYGLLLSRFPDSTQFLAPAHGGSAALSDPDGSGNGGGGGGNGGGGGGTQGEVVLAKPGQFFVASNGNSVLEVPIPAPAGQYFSRAVVELDMRTGKIFVGFNATVALLRPRPDGALYFGHFVRGNNKNGPVEKTIIDVNNETAKCGTEPRVVAQQQLPSTLGSDAVAGNLTLTVVQGGQIVEQSSGPRHQLRPRPRRAGHEAGLRARQGGRRHVLPAARLELLQPEGHPHPLIAHRRGAVSEPGP